MSCTVVIGTQWGDEGKAKMIDYFTKDADKSSVIRVEPTPDIPLSLMGKNTFSILSLRHSSQEKICVIATDSCLIHPAHRGTGKA
jgi:hypothetical protein